MIKILLNIILNIHFAKNNFYDKYFFLIKTLHVNLFEHFTLHLHFMTIMCNTLHRGRKTLNPRPTLRMTGMGER